MRLFADFPQALSLPGLYRFVNKLKTCGRLSAVRGTVRRYINLESHGEYVRIVRYLKHSKGIVALIALLLLAQAFADLSLPRYTADIVDVGIQQAGIEKAVPDRMRASTYDAIMGELSESSGSALVEECFDGPVENDSPDAPEGASDVYVLNDYGKDHIDDLEQVIARPLVAADLPEALSAPGAAASGAALDGSDGSLVRQQAIAAVKAEYEAVGYDSVGVQMRYLLLTGAKMLAMTLLFTAASLGVGFFASRLGAKIGRQLRAQIFERVVSFTDAEVQKFSPASLITRATNDVQQVQMVIVVAMRIVLYSPIVAIGGVFMVATTNVSMTWIIVLAVILIAIIIGIVMAVTLHKFKIVQKLIDKVNLVSREILNGVSVIRAFDRQDTEERRFDEANRDLMKTQLFTGRTMAFMMPAMTLVMNGLSVLVVWVGSAYADAGTIQVGDMIAFITYSMVIIMSFLMIGMVAIVLPRAEVAAQRIDEVIGTECSVADKGDGHPVVCDHGVSVEFDDVSFSYEGDGEPVLSHISFTAEAGKTTAIIGSTGCGKSTILKLIERFYDVTDGAVRVGGVDVRDMPQSTLRHAVSYVPQSSFLFGGTIRSNIAYSDEALSDESVARAARIAQASDFIEAKQEGYATPVSQGGTNVSGGQRQRLSIARAVASDADAYLFDDSFSALDYATDAAVRKALHDELGGRTVVIVAQRISTVLNADKIVVLEDGRIVGCGRHAELMETCPTYQEIARSQLSDEELSRPIASRSLKGGVSHEQ